LARFGVGAQKKGGAKCPQERKTMIQSRVSDVLTEALQGGLFCLTEIRDLVERQ